MVTSPFRIHKAPVQILPGATHLTRRGLTEKDRAWWQSQRTFGLCQAIRQVRQRAELSYVADRLKTPGSIQKLKRLIDHSFPSEYRVAM